MTRRMFFGVDPHPMRKLQHKAFDLAEEMLRLESELLEVLKRIDRGRFYVKYGFKSLLKFCTFSLGLSRTQAQRLLNQVRRTEPTLSSGTKEVSKIVSTGSSQRKKTALANCAPLELRRAQEAKSRWPEEEEPCKPIDVAAIFAASGVSMDGIASDEW